MSTFSAYGMGPKGFLVNRPLNDDEIANHLDVHRPASQRVHYDLSLTKLNSTFVECVDKWYSMRGFVALAGACFGAAMLYAIGVGIHIFMNSNDWFFITVALVPAIGLWWMARFFLSDAFTYTHYPIRFNRRNRQVYAFRRDGTVLKAGWEDFYWTIYNTKLGLGGGDLNVMGHLLDKDGITIRESIGLSLVDAGESGKQNILQCFEFLRLYMQEGPGPVLEALKPVPLIMLPGIHKTKETWLFGWQHLTNGMKGMPVFQILFQPFLFPISLFRWIVMRTSKIPQWPQWVEDECRIDPDDPWIRDERHAAR